jgi:hypothetical protein
MKLMAAPDQVLAIIREWSGRSILAAFNFSAERVRLSLPMNAHIEPLSGHGFEPCDVRPGSIDLPPAGVFFGTLRSGKS